MARTLGSLSLRDETSPSHRLSFHNSFCRTIWGELCWAFLLVSAGFGSSWPGFFLYLWPTSGLAGAGWVTLVAVGYMGLHAVWAPMSQKASPGYRVLGAAGGQALVLKRFSNLCLHHGCRCPIGQKQITWTGRSRALGLREGSSPGWTRDLLVPVFCCSLGVPRPHVTRPL